MSDEEKEAQQRLQDEQAADSTKRVLSTATKGVGSAYAGPEVGTIIDAAEQIPEVDHVEREISKGVNEVASIIDPNAKKNLAENNAKIATATNIADNAMSLGSGSTNFGKGTPENINLDNSGYNPNLNKMQATPTEAQNASLNPNSINQDITPREESNEELNELSKKHSKTNNINDTAKGEVKIPPIVLILLPIVGGLLFITFFVLVIFHAQINDESISIYKFVNTSNINTCGRVIFKKDLELLKDKIAEYDKKINKAVNKSDVEEVNKLTKEKYDLIPSITIDEYVSWIVEKEVGDLESEDLYKIYAVIARTYLFNNSSIEDNFCIVEQPQNNGVNTENNDYVEVSNATIKDIVSQTHDYVLVDNDIYVNTKINSFCEDHNDEDYYYLKERNQALDKPWVDEKVNDKNESSQCNDTNGKVLSKYGAYYLLDERDYGWKDTLAYYYQGNIEIKRVNILEMEKDGTILNAAVGEVNGNLPLSSLGLAWPVANITRCSSPFGWRGLGGGTNHRGIDIPQALGTPVYAATDGKVVNVYDNPLCSNIGSYGHSCPGAGKYGSLGNHVIIETADGVQTIYGHMKQGSITVFFGQQVVQGTKIGEVASSGSSTGYHLHFGVRINNVYQNPFNYLANLPESCGG